jgi:acyl-homoserine lactone synthase
MIQIVTGENRTGFHWELLEMHRHRKTVFIDQMGWEIDCSEGLEIDEFDGPGAIYLLDLDAKGGLQSSVRLLPTDCPHLMSEVFPHLCRDGVPRGPLIWEASRYCPSPGIADAAERRTRLAAMIAGVIETGLLFGIEQVTLVTSLALKRTAAVSGWRLKPLGEPVTACGERTGAYAGPVSADALRRVRAENGLLAPVSRHMAAERRAA